MKVLSKFTSPNPIAIRIVRNFSIAAVSGLISRFVTLVSTAYLARILGVEQLGQIGFAEGVFAFVILLSDLGLQTIGMREIAKNRHDSTISTTIVNSVVSIQFALVTIWYLIIIGLVSIWTPEGIGNKWLLPIYGICVLYPFLPTLEWWLNALEQLHITALLRIVKEILFLAVVFLLAKLENPLFSVPLALAISTLVVSFYINYIYYKTYRKVLKFHFDGIFWRGLLKSSLPVGLTNLLNQVSVRSALVLLGIFSTTLELGFFTAAWKVFYVGLEIQSVINMAVYPVLARLYVSDRSAFYKIRQQFLALTVIIAFCLFWGVNIFASQVTSTLFGQGYATSGLVLQLLGTGLAFVFSSTSFAITLLVSENEKFLIFPSMSGAITNIILTIFLTPIYGAIGAAWAYLLSALVTTVLLVSFYFFMPLKERA